MPRFLRFLLGVMLVGACASARQVSVTVPSTTFPPPSVDAATAATPPSLSGISGAGTVELGQNVVLTVLFYDTGDVQTYQWAKSGNPIPGATGISYTIGAAAANDAGTYTVTVTNATGSSVASTSLTVKSLGAPVVTSQPYSLVLQVGQEAVFSFAATGSYPRTYQWRKDGNSIAGATQASYTIAAIKLQDAATYSVVVSNSQGSATSSSASLTVNAATPPVLYSFYPGDIATTAGAAVSLSTYLTGGSSPFTYQWFKNGAAIAGATASQLTFSAIALTDAGRYYATVTNAAGSANTRESVVTVSPPTPVTISSQPQSQNLAEGQSMYLSVYANGSSPVSYQWRKDGNPIASATYSSYAIDSVALSDAGSYTVTITNPAGTLTSTAAVLTVTKAVAPSIATAPQSQSIPYGGYIALNVQATGTSPFQYAWSKDGVAIPGATYSSYNLSSAMVAASGQYTVTVTNRAGSVTSPAANVVVASPVLPVINGQPQSINTMTGSSFSLYVNFSSTGAGDVTVQWLKDGVSIPGATYSGYTVNSANASDAGTYVAVLLGLAGAVISSPATVTVAPPAPPSFSSSYYSYSSITYATVGSSASLSTSNLQASGTLTYQWMKDGVAIAGATSATLSIPAVTTSDYGTYVLIVTGDGGVAASATIRLRPQLNSNSGGSGEPWLDIGRVGDTVYVLSTAPARIDRYSLSSESWLTPTLLGEVNVPTAFCPTDAGIFIAYGRALVRRSLDLSNETSILNATSNITQMFSLGKYIYYNTSSTSTYSVGFSSVDRSTLQPGPVIASSFYGSSGRSAASFAPSLRKGFTSSSGVSPGDILMYSFNADGTLLSSADSPYHGTMPVSSRAYVFPGDQLVADNAGTIYRTADLTYAGSFGEGMTDLTFFEDGSPVFLRGQQLIAARSDNYTETGRGTLSDPGYRVYTRSGSAYVFGKASSTQPFTVMKRTQASLAPAVLPPAENPGGRISIDAAFRGPDGLVYVLSRSRQAMLRYDPATNTYLTSIPLRSAPVLAYHQPGNSRALLVYGDGVVTQFPLNRDASESALFNIGQYVRGLVDLGDMVLVNFSEAQDSGDDRMVVGGSGGPRFINRSLYEALGLAWQPATRRLYSSPALGGSSLQYEVLLTDGQLDTPAGTPSSSSATTLTPPIRFSSDGTLLLTANGVVLNSELAKVGVLSNDVTDGVWMTNGLYTIRSSNGQTQVQRWDRTSYVLSGAVSVPGTPVRIFATSASQLLVVTNRGGYLTFNALASDLTIASPSSVTSFAGYYTAKVTGNGGDVALYLRTDGTGVLVANLLSPTAQVVSATASIDGTGNLLIPTQTLGGGSARTVVASVSSDGKFTGTISGVAFAGTRATGSSSLAGFYQLTALNGTSGFGYAIVSPDGQAVMVAQTNFGVDGGTGMLSNREWSTTSATGAKLTGKIDSAYGLLTVSADRGALVNTSLGGASDQVLPSKRLVNISSRGRAGPGEDTLIAGFVVTGNTPKALLIRAVGPALAGFGITDALKDPVLTLFKDGAQIAMSDNWSSEAAAADIAAATSRVGGFALPSPGKDAALYVTLAPGAYTTQVSAKDGTTAVALVEVYDAGDAGPTLPRVVNISTRARVGADQQVLIAGFVISGNVPKRVMIRAVGPTLTKLGVDSVLPDPVLSINASGSTIATNDNWAIQSNGQTAADIILASNTVGGFPLVTGSKDAAIVVTLAPGLYTAVVSSKDTTPGVALVEVYEMP